MRDQHGWARRAAIAWALVGGAAVFGLLGVGCPSAGFGNLMVSSAAGPLGAVSVVRPAVKVSGASVQSYTFTVRNDSSKPITRLAVNLIVSWADGESFVVTHTADALADPAARPLAPGASLTFGRGGQLAADSGANVQAVSIQVAHVDFADGTSLDPAAAAAAFEGPPKCKKVMCSPVYRDPITRGCSVHFKAELCAPNASGDKTYSGLVSCEKEEDADSNCFCDCMEGTPGRVTARLTRGGEPVTLYDISCPGCTKPKTCPPLVATATARATATAATATAATAPPPISISKPEALAIDSDGDYCTLPSAPDGGAADMAIAPGSICYTDSAALTGKAAVLDVCKEGYIPSGFSSTTNYVGACSSACGGRGGTCVPYPGCSTIPNLAKTNPGGITDGTFMHDPSSDVLCACAPMP